MKITINSYERNVIMACLYTYEKQMQHALKGQNSDLARNSGALDELKVIAEIKEKLSQGVLA
jgi:hypothetical protein